MALKYYHAEPVANSLKSMIPLKEKGLEFESIYFRRGCRYYFQPFEL